MITHVPLLQIQRDLHDIPRGMERFQAYLKTIANEEGDDLSLPPLVGMNPMGREHVSARLEELLALGAEEIAERATAEACRRLHCGEDDLKHGMVIMDDLRGGWTNRYACEYGFCFPEGRGLRNRRWAWISTPLWVSETPTRESVRCSVLRSIARTMYVQEHGECFTLREMLRQEGEIARFVGQEPTLDSEEIAYTTAVLEPLLDTTDYPTRFVAMFGDIAAEMLGYPKLGLSDRAGFSLAIAHRF